MGITDVSWDVFVRGILPFTSAFLYLLILIYFTLLREEVRAYKYFAIFFICFSLFLIGPMVNMLPLNVMQKYFDLLRNILFFSFGIPCLVLALLLEAKIHTPRQIQALPFLLGIIWSIYFAASPPLKSGVILSFPWGVPDIPASDIYVTQAVFILLVLSSPCIVIFRNMNQYKDVSTQRNISILCLNILWLCICMCAGLIFQKWELYYGGASSTAIIWAYALFRNIHLNRLKFKQTPNLQYSLQKRDICDENINTGISSEQMLVDKITNYILSNYQKNINLNDVIDETGISRSKATKVFKEVTKSTINEYLTMVRIEHAKSLLLTKSVTVTAFDVGFNNPSYFTTVFKKYTKQSPTEYQHRAKKPNAISV